MSLKSIRRALLSVSEKTNLLDFARGLVALGIELVSTGGTYKVLLEGGLQAREVRDLTGFPEMLDGRVKTLHPHIHAGILAIRADPTHLSTLELHGIGLIDLVAVNLYPFEATVSRPDVQHSEAIENIDIGGPTLIRSAAKNHQDVAVVTSPSQYPAVLDELRVYNGALTQETRERLAVAAFARTAAYDRAICAYFSGRGTFDEFPQRLELGFERRDQLRYGENPHQRAAFYVEPAPPADSLARATVLHGKELSYNNLLDLDSALGLVREFDPTSNAFVVVLKHNNPCGAAIAPTLAEAFQKAYEGDPLSAFGGVLGFNRPVDVATAQLLTEPNRFVECLIAPEYTPEAFELLTTRPSWKKSVRLLRTGPLLPRNELQSRLGLELRRIDGGLLVQSRDRSEEDFALAKVVTQRGLSEAELADLRFAWLVCKHVKSNAIVLARGGAVVGVGAGQMSRVDSVHLAARKAGDRACGAVLASDAFFPFRDNVDEAARVGVTALVQPGGSVRDEDSIAAANEHGLAMLFTGIRHFRH